MNVFENVKMAISSLFAHKMRSLLTMLGIIIGVGSVIAVVAIGQGGESVLKSQFTGDANSVELTYNPSEEEIQANPNILFESAFTQRDIELIKDIPEVDTVVTKSTESSQVRYREESTDGFIIGVNNSYVESEEIKVDKGRTLVSADFISGARVAVVSHSYKESLFEDIEGSMLGNIIYIGNQPVEIVGIMEKSDSFFDLSVGSIYLPVRTWQTIFSDTSITEVKLKVANADDLEVAGKKATELLNRIHETDKAYEVVNLEAIADGIGKVTRIMTIIISSIAGVSLLVGGIGVMNIMLVSVTERTREIGVRMSLGATRGQILFQFLIESMTLTLIGGLLGMILGTGAAFTVSAFAGWPPLVSLPVIIGGILFSMVIGIVFGILPANKASRLDPIEALRYE